MNSRNSGASPEQWAYLNALGDDVRYIVPIVSNPALPAVGALAQNSRMRGKVPSVKTSRGEAMGLPGWQTHDSAPDEVMRWSRDPDMGYGFRTGHGGIIAIDCDIDDPEICSAVAQMLANAMDINWQDIPRRTHRTARWATLIRVEGIDTQPKHILEWTDGSGNKIEFLGTGQQLACAGRHPSGDWYEWSSAPFPIPVISQDEFKEFISAIRKEWNVSTSKIDIAPIRVKGKTILSVDKLADWLRDTGRVLETGQGGELYITCPWEENHTTETGARATVYFPIGSNGYLGGGFKCLHAHCADKTLEDFREWAISQGFSEVPADAYPDETETAKETESKKQKPKDKKKKRDCLGLQDVLDLMSNDENLSGVCFNELEQKIEIVGHQLPWHTSDTAGGFWRDADDAHLQLYAETAYGPLFQSTLSTALTIMADNRSYHPVRRYIDSLPEWDHHPRAESIFIDYLGAEDSLYVREATRKTLCAAVLRAFQPGIKFDTMPVLNGPQGIGKGTLLAKLGGKWFSDSFSLADTKDKTAAENIQGFWLVEMSELDGGMKRAEVETIKAFVSRQVDNYRAAYGKRTERHPRQCVFIGTANAESGYLKDVTGNRRFWPIVVTGESQKKPWDLTQAEVDQIWAEVRVMIDTGETLLLSKEAAQAAECAQTGALETDEREGLISDYLNKRLPIGWDKLTSIERQEWLNSPNSQGSEVRKSVCSLEIWCECFGNAASTLKKSDSIAITSVLLKLGWRKGDRSYIPLYGRQRLFVRS